MENLQELEVKKTTADITVATKVPTEGKLSYEAQKEKQKQVRRAEKAVADNEAEVAKLENKIYEIESKLAEGQTDGDLLAQYEKAKKSLDEKMYEWEILTEELEKLKNE